MNTREPRNIYKKYNYIILRINIINSIKTYLELRKYKRIVLIYKIKPI